MLSAFALSRRSVGLISLAAGSGACLTALTGCVSRTYYVDHPVPAAGPTVVRYVETPAVPVPEKVDPTMSGNEVVIAPPEAPGTPTAEPAAPTVIVRQAAPPPMPRPLVVREVVTAAPGPGYVYIRGRYEWIGSRYVWYPAHWARPAHRSLSWHAGSWYRGRGGWTWRAGHWR